MVQSTYTAPLKNLTDNKLAIKLRKLEKAKLSWLGAMPSQVRSLRLLEIAAALEAVHLESNHRGIIL